MYHISGNTAPEQLHLIIYIRPCRISVEITFSLLQVSVTTILADPFPCCKKEKKIKKSELKSL